MNNWNVGSFVRGETPQSREQIHLHRSETSPSHKLITISDTTDSEERALSRLKCFNSTFEDEATSVPSECANDRLSTCNYLMSPSSNRWDSAVSSAFVPGSISSGSSRSNRTAASTPFSSSAASSSDVTGTASSQSVTETASSDYVSGSGTHTSSSSSPSHSKTASSYSVEFDEHHTHNMSNTSCWDYDGQYLPPNCQLKAKYLEFNSPSDTVASWEDASLFPTTTHEPLGHIVQHCKGSQRKRGQKDIQHQKSSDPYKMLRSFKDRFDSRNRPLSPNLSLLSGIRASDSPLDAKMDEVVAQSTTILRPLTISCRNDGDPLVDIQNHRVYLEKRADEISAFNASISVCNAALKQRLHDIKKIQKELRKFERKMQTDIDSLVEETERTKEEFRSTKERHSQMERKEFVQMQKTKHMAISDINVSMQTRQIEIENERFKRGLRDCKKRRQKLAQNLSRLVPEGNYNSQTDFESAIVAAKRTFCDKYTQYLRTCCHNEGENILRTEKRLEQKAYGGRMKNLHKMAKELYGPQLLGEYYYMDFL